MVEVNDRPQIRRRYETFPVRAATHSIEKPWFALAAIVLLSLPLLFFFLGAWSFLDPDEGRYGQIPYQMLIGSDFITPRQNGVKFFDKPPLLYWAVAASYAIFGYHEWAARLVPATAALTGLLIVYGLGRRMFGVRAGLIGAVILATSFIWPIMARIVVTDMLVSVLVFLSLALWWLGHSEKPEEVGQRQLGYFVGFWTVLALAVLAKGPIAVVLTFGCICLYMLLCRQWQALSQMRWAIGVPLFAVITAPWFILVAQRNPEFNHFFWYDQHIGRFLGNTTGNDHVQGADYYFKFLPLVFFPWSFFVPAAIIAGWSRLRNVTRSEPSAKQRSVIYLLGGVIFPLLFFSASSGKLLTYILPIVPPMALLMAAYFDELLARRVRWNRVLSVGMIVLASLLGAGAVVVAVLALPTLRSLGVDERAAAAIGVLLMAWATGLVLLSRRFGSMGVVTGTAGGFTVTFIAVLLIVASIMPRFTTESLVEYIRPGLAAKPQSQVLTIGYIRSVPFYTGRRVKVVGTPDELKLGAAELSLEERHRWFYDGAGEADYLRALMLHPHPVYCFMHASRRTREMGEKLMARIGHSAIPIVANERFLVFGNRAAVAITPPLSRVPRQ